MEVSACLYGMSAVSYWREVRHRVASANSMDVDDPQYQPLLVRLLGDEPLQLDLGAMPSVCDNKAYSFGITPGLVQRARTACHCPSEEKAELLVRSPGLRRYYAGADVRVLSSDLPPGSFVQVSPQLYAPSPELTLLMMASWIGLAELSLLICEFCGLYSQDVGSAGFVNCPQLTTPSQLRKYLVDVLDLAAGAGSRSPRGLPNLTLALAWSPELCASPAEAVCALMLGMPRSRGGYGLPTPCMNRGIYADGVRYACDLSWPDSKAVLEYQSDLHKSGSTQSGDRSKSNALLAAGYEVFQAGKEDLKRLKRADQLASLLGRALGVSQLRPSEAFRKKQVQLRRVLLAGWWGEGRGGIRA